MLPEASTLVILTPLDLLNQIQDQRVDWLDDPLESMSNSQPGLGGGIRRDLIAEG